MSSGSDAIVINQAERAVSTDINRLQSLGSKARMESMRWLLDVFQGYDDDGAAATATEYTTAGSPMLAEIVGGLCVVPQNGTLALGVQGGLAYVIDPDATPTSDDSPYKHVQDAGGMPVCTATAGNVSLAIAPNTSGSIRIDVVECTRVDDPTPEEDSRDVFNPSTGLFTATTLTKVTGSVFQYRVRAGTPGSGYPGSVAEWLPLCIASVPAGATVNDQITFWDVRPLVNDRQNGPTNTAQAQPRRTKLLHTSAPASGTQYLANGLVEANLYGPGLTGGRRLGGTLRRGSPGSDSSYALPCCDFGDAANQENAYANPGSGLAYFYLVRMFGLPRWARYTDATAGVRSPRSPRGIPILSLVGPWPVSGTPLSPIELPAVFGFNGATTSDAICWGATCLFTGGGPQTAPQTTADGWTYLSDPAPKAGAWNSGTSTGTVTLTENQQFPASATRLKIHLKVEVNIATGGPQVNLQFGFPNGGPTLEIEDGPTIQNVVQTILAPTTVNATQSSTADLQLEWDFDVALPTAYPTTTNTPIPYLLSFVLSTIGFSLPSQVTFSNVSAQVVGFQLE